MRQAINKDHAQLKSDVGRCLVENGWIVPAPLTYYDH